MRGEKKKEGGRWKKDSGRGPEPLKTVSCQRIAKERNLSAREKGREERKRKGKKETAFKSWVCRCVSCEGKRLFFPRAEEVGRGKKKGEGGERGERKIFELRTSPAKERQLDET